MPNRKKLFILILSFFVLRLGFGLFRSQLFGEIDYFQTYLIGLKCYTTGTWPWFGPDVNGAENSFKSQIPGALEGLLAGGAFYVLPFPEAPFVLLNLLSIAGVALLAWYIHRRLPSLPYTWVFIWIAVCPWSIQESTTTINPAYIFLPSILFFIGFMESLPFFTMNIVPPPWANAAMGFSFFWIMQFHFSYVYLAPLILFSLGAQIFKVRRWNSLVFFALGCLPTLSFLVPTYVKYGLSTGNVASGFAVPFDWGNVRDFWVILARFFSLVCSELPIFIGTHTSDRIRFITMDHPYLSIPGPVLWIGGLLQPFVLAAFWLWELRLRFQLWFWGILLALCVLLAVAGPDQAAVRVGGTLLMAAVLQAIGYGFSRLKWKMPGPHWPGLNLLLLAAFALVYTSFWFTIKRPLSHIYFVFFPLIMTYSCYVWAALKGIKFGPLIAKIFVVLAVIFQVGYAVAVEPTDSIYPKWPLMKQAIDQKNYHVLGERRPESLY